MTTSNPEPITGQEDFAEVYSTVTGLKQRVPRHFVGHPVLGRNLRLTPAQRELDGDLPPRPTQESTVPELDEFAESAGITLPSRARHDEKLSAIEAVFVHDDVQAGMEPVDLDPAAYDPLNPSAAAQLDPTEQPGVAVTTPAPDADDESGDESGDDTHEQGGNPPPDETPADGDEE